MGYARHGGSLAASTSAAVEVELGRALAARGVHVGEEQRRQVRRRHEQDVRAVRHYSQYRNSCGACGGEENMIYRAPADGPRERARQIEHTDPHGRVPGAACWIATGTR